jgi:hypothetical protein
MREIEDGANSMKKILLSIAGYDPTSGAGVILDLDVFRFLGFWGTAVLTAVTSQNTEGINEIHSLPPEFLWSQYQALLDDVSFSGIKAGICPERKWTSSSTEKSLIFWKRKKLKKESTEQAVSSLQACWLIWPREIRLRRPSASLRNSLKEPSERR